MASWAENIRAKREAEPVLPPEKVAGMADEIIYLRSRGFAVTAGIGEFKGWWKVDGNYRSTEWVIEKVAGLKARSLRNAPPPVKLTGDAPVAIVSTVAAAEADDPEIAAADKALDAPAGTARGRAVDYRGLGPDGVRECLQALLPHFPNAWVMGGVLGDQKNFSLMLSGKRAISAKIVEALYGPTGAELLPRWLELIAGGPVTVPEPEPEPTPQPPSNPDTMPDPEAPAAETAPLLPPSGAAGAGPVSEPGASPEEAAAGDGAAASIDHEKTAGPGTGEARVDAAAFAESPAAEPDAARFGQVAGDGQDSPAFHSTEGWLPPQAREILGARPGDGAREPLPGAWRICVSSSVSVPEQPGLPSWAGIEDKDLLPILKGKAAGMAAEIAEIEAEYSAGVRALEALSQRSRAIERRRAALIAAINEFEEEERAHGDEGKAG